MDVVQYAVTKTKMVVDFLWITIMKRERQEDCFATHAILL